MQEILHKNRKTGNLGSKESAILYEIQFIIFGIYVDLHSNNGTGFI